MNSQSFRKPRIAITGIGMICALGIDTKNCWQGMLEGRSGIRHIRRFDSSNCLTQIAGELPEDYFEMEQQAFTSREYRNSTLASRATILAARQAIEDSKLDLSKLEKEKVAVITGCGGSTYGDEIAFANYGRKKKRKVPIVSHGMLNALSACLTIEFGFMGPSFNVATACASGAHAVGIGYDYVCHTGGKCLVVGVDTMVYEDTIQGFNQLLALSDHNAEPEKASRPFDKKRKGFVLSEGACAIMLESYDTAIARSASIYASIAGYAATSEAHNIIAPDMSGKSIAVTIEHAIQHSGIEKKQIGYISAHGTSTYHNDLAETRAVKVAFGDDAYEIPISSQKSMIGHSIGAAGAIEVAVCALSLQKQILTPTINYEVPDPECDLNYVPNTARTVNNLNAALSNSFGFGGHNCVIVLTRFGADL